MESVGLTREEVRLTLLVHAKGEPSFLGSLVPFNAWVVGGPFVLGYCSFRQSRAT